MYIVMCMPTTMHRTQLYLPQMHVQKLRHLASKRKVTISQVIRSLIEEELINTKQKPRPKGEGLLSAAARINKKGIRGPKDLSKRVDHYLYGRI